MAQNFVIDIHDSSATHTFTVSPCSGLPTEFTLKYDMGLWHEFKAQTYSVYAASIMAHELRLRYEFFFEFYVKACHRQNYRFRQGEIDSYKPTQKWVDILRNLQPGSPLLDRAMELETFAPRNPT